MSMLASSPAFSAARRRKNIVIALCISLLSSGVSIMAFAPFLLSLTNNEAIFVPHELAKTLV